MSKMSFAWRLAGAGALAGAGLFGLAGMAGASGGAGDTNVHGAPSTLTYVIDQMGDTAPAFPAFTIAPDSAPSCPFADEVAYLQFVPNEGNGVEYGTSNKNGGWGGDNGEGPGEIVGPDGTTVLYTGHLHEWGGGGNNAQGQNENGFTASFNGTDGSGGTVTAQGQMHTTTNAQGNTVVDNMTVTITCS